MIDHLVYAAPNLREAIAFIAGRVRVHPAEGGSHPRWGTRNALLGLGEDLYLEIIGPDPDLPPPEGPRPFGLDDLSGPRLVTWAAKAPGIEDRVRRARAAGYDPGPVVEGARDQPDGTRLSWRLSLPKIDGGDGLVPFLIDWGSSFHPAKSAPQGCTLVKLSGVHPDASGIRKTLERLDVELEVFPGEAPGLVAVLDTPGGELRLE